jgi:membrane-bound ClpP family serine protease
VTPLEPEGMVFVRGEYWSALSPTPVPAGAKVRVTAIDQLKLAVEPVEDRPEVKT